MSAERTTLNQFLIEERRQRPTETGDLYSLISGVAKACKLVAAQVARGALSNEVTETSSVNVQGEVRHRIDVLANEIFLRSIEKDGYLAGIVSEEMEMPVLIPSACAKSRYLLAFDPLDGTSNVDINGSIGSIFSILLAPQAGGDAAPADFLQPGTKQVCAGYAIYGPATMLVISVGTGVHAFTLAPELGDFVLTHPAISIPHTTNEFAINASNSRFWEPAVRRYVQECLAGKTGPRQKDFNMRWVASLVAETHRILMCGGVFLYPRDTKLPPKAGSLRLLCEASPISFIIEQAGGLASTGRGRILEVVPTDLHQCIPFIFGAREEVEAIEAYHREQNAEIAEAPLFGSRGLFRATA